MSSRRRKPTPPFVMTLSAVSLVACGRDATTATPTPTATPTVNVLPAESASAAPTATASTNVIATSTAIKDDRVDFADYPRALNATDANGERIYRTYEATTSCYIELPWPKGQPRMPGQVKTQNVACPPAMKTPAWQACPGGTIGAKKDAAAECACFQMGNPPPIPRRVACP